MWANNFVMILGVFGTFIVMLVSIVVWLLGAYFQMKLSDHFRWGMVGTRAERKKKLTFYSVLLWIAVTLVSLVAGTTFYTIVS